MSSIFAHLQNLIPSGPGLLPKWQMVVAVAAFFNTVQNFMTLKLTRQIYTGVPSHTVTPLQARTFAVWTLTSAVVRFYAAYHIADKTIYDLTLFTYLIAFGHFVSEIAIYRTARIGVPVLMPVLVASSSLIWMMNQYDFYVKD